MDSPLQFLVIEGYPKESRDQFDEVGMRLAGVLYEDLVHQHLPDAICTTWIASDDPGGAPGNDALPHYDGILWPGCNLTVYHDHDERVAGQLDLARRAYEAGVPQFGSCWGIQVAVVAAGGEVGPHKDGREMGLARKIHVTDAGKDHPMMEDKPAVYSHFVSHDDEVKTLPEGAVLLAGNFHSRVQAVAVTHQNGAFWATQYHPEYDLHEVARLVIAREPKLVKQGFFRGHDDLMEYVDKLEALYQDPSRKDLRWQLDIDDDVLDDRIRQREFTNWLEKVVLPKAGQSTPII